MTDTTTQSAAPPNVLESRIQNLLGAMLSRGFSYRSNAFFSLLRRFRPVLRSGPYTMVACDDDVREVLARHDDFSVSLYGMKMEQITGPFFLGIDDRAEYDHDHTAVRRAVRPEDLGGIDADTGRIAQGLVAGAAPQRRIDVVGGLADPVVAATAGTYFGTPGPDPATLLRWARILFQEIFFNVSNDPRVTAEADAAAAELRGYLDDLIARRHQALARGDRGPDDVVGRLIEAQGGEPPFLDDPAIRTNLLGLIVGWLPLVSKSVALALYELLRRPPELAAAREAARAGDDDLLAAHVFEALRFRPPSVGLLRRSTVDCTIAQGSPREATIAEGRTVFVLTQSAMMDPRTIDHPGQFRVDRPWGEYLHFGYGMHTCFGQAIARRQIPLILKTLLGQGPVSRIRGSAGRISWTGPFPSRLHVAFE